MAKKNCVVNTKTDKEPSKLLEQLVSITGDMAVAKKAYAYFETKEFIDIFSADTAGNKKGNYLHEPEQNSSRLNDQNEPKLFYNKKLNKYYYKDKYNEPVFYPHIEQGLRGFFSSNEIKELAQSFAYSYYNEELSLDSETSEIINIGQSTLKEYLERVISIKATQLMNSPELLDYSIGMKLDESLDEIDEWVEEVRNFFRSIKVESSLEDEMSIAEESGKDTIMRTESFLTDPKSSINNNVKLFLSLIKSSKVNSFGDNTFVSFDEINTILTNAFSDLAISHNEIGELDDLFDMYVEKIEELLPYKPYLQDLVDKLREPGITENWKNQFVQAFRLVKNNFLGSELVITYNEDVKNVVYTVRNLSESSKRKGNIINQWKFNFEMLNVKDNTSKRYAKNFREGADNLSRNVFKIQKSMDNGNFSEIEKAKKNLKTILGKIGVVITDQGLNYHLYEGQSDPSKVNNENVLLRLINLFEGSARELEHLMETKVNENLFDYQGVFKQLASAEAFFIEEGSDSTIFSVGKQKWVRSRPSFLALEINKWKKDPSILIKRYESTEYSKESLWMAFLTAEDITSSYEDRIAESKRRLEGADVFIFNSVQAKGDSSNAVDNKDVTETDALNDYIHKILGSRFGNGKTIHKTGLAADKSTEIQLSFGSDPSAFNISTDAYSQDGVIKVSDRILDIFYKYFRAEYKRMAYEHEFVKIGENKDKLRQNYHLGNKNAFKSQMFPSLSISYDVDGNVVLPKIDFDLYDVDGVPLYENLDEIKGSLKPLIQEALSNRIQATYDTLFEEKLMSFDKNGQIVNNAIDSTLFATLQRDGNIDLAIVKLAADVTVNSLVSQVEFSKMFSGDVAYYKTTEDYFKRVPSTYTDGQYMRLSSGEEYFNIAVIESVKVPPGSLDSMREFLPESLVKQYENVNSTDGQAWITPQRWKFIMERLGKPQHVVDSIYKKMFEDTPQVMSKKELKLLSTILKGVHYELTEEGVPVFLKYSQAVLIPSMIKNTPLQRVYDKMTEGDYQDHVHELITIDGIKMGSLKPTRIHDETGGIAEHFALQKQVLRNEYWKLQQDLPVKGLKESDLGSQLQKNAFAALAHNKETMFTLGDGTDLTGDEMIEYLNGIVSALHTKGVNSVIEDLDIDFSVDAAGRAVLKFNNEDKIFDKLISQMKRRRETPDNFIKALEAKISPYGVPGSKVMVHNLFTSYIIDSVTKVKTNGGGFIQMADFGLSFNEASKKNSGIRLTPWFKNSADKTLHTPKVIGVNSKTGKKIIQPGGCFISGSFLSKHIPDWEQYTDKQLFEGDENNPPLIDQRILQQLIGYRIPNQGLASTDALTVMGILPHISADTIIPYTGITTKNGSDFDIDKMYLMIPSFEANYNVNTEKIYDYIKEKIHGNTLDISVENIQKLLEDLEISEEDLREHGFILDEFYNDIEDRSARTKAISVSDRVLVKALLSDANKEHPIVKDLFKDNDIKLTSLSYVDTHNDILEHEDLKKLPLKVLQNKLIDAYSTIFLDETTIGSVMTPIDSSLISGDIKNLIGTKTSQDLELFDAVSQLKTRFEFRGGKNGLGQNVNAAVDSVISSMADLNFRSYYLGQGHFNSDKETLFDRETSKELSDSEIKFYIEHFNSREEDVTKHLSFKEHADLIRSFKLNDTMTSLINGFVDIVNDSFIVKGNWTVQTNNIGFMLIRAGVHPFVVNSFLKQPILEKYVKFVTTMESNVIDFDISIIHEFKLKYAQESIDPNEDFILEVDDLDIPINKADIFKKFFTGENTNWFSNPSSKHYQKNLDNFADSVLPSKIAEYIGLEKTEAVTKKSRKKKGKSETKYYYPKYVFEQLKDLSASLMLEYIKVVEVSPESSFKDLNLQKLREQMTEPDMETQLSIFMTFMEFQNASKQLTKNIKASRTSVDGPGKDISSVMIKMNVVSELNENDDVDQELAQALAAEGKPLLGNFKSKLEYAGQPTMLKSSIDSSLYFTYNIMRSNPKFFLTASDSIYSTFNQASEYIYGNSLQGEYLAEKLEQAYYTYMLSGFKPLKMNQDERRDILLDMVDEVKEMVNKYPKNKLLTTLYPKPSESFKFARTTEEFQDKRYYKKFILSFPNLQSTTGVKNDVVDAWSDLLQDEPEFAERLIKYSYLTSGFNYKSGSFFQVIPYMWFNKNRFNSYITQYAANINQKDIEGNGAIDTVFLDQFFKNHKDDKRIVKSKAFVQKGNVTIESKGVKTTISQKTAFRTEENHGYFLKISSEIEGRTYENFYRLQGVDKDGMFVYVRSAPLGFRDSKGNSIPEYFHGKKGLISNNTTENLSDAKVDIEHFNLVVNSRQINHVYKDKTFISERSFDNLKSDEVLAKDVENNNKRSVTRKTGPATESKPTSEESPGIKTSLVAVTTSVGAIRNKQGTGNIMIDGMTYDMAEESFEIVSEDNVDWLFVFMNNEQDQAIVVGSRNEGEINFELDDNLKTLTRLRKEQEERDAATAPKLSPKIEALFPTIDKKFGITLEHLAAIEEEHGERAALDFIKKCKGKI